MIRFPVPPDDCLILNAFNQADSLRGAAALLGMDPPALVRKVQRISTELGYLQKVGNRWALTDAGRHMAYWTETALQSQKEFSAKERVLRISAFPWLGEESLIPALPKLNGLMKADLAVRIQLTARNHEKELLQGRTDFVIQGHAPTDPLIAYKRVHSLYWLAVAPASWNKALAASKSEGKRDFLNERPFIRHEDLNPEVALGFQPETMAKVSMDSVNGIRAAVVNGQGWSVLPAMSADRSLKANHLLDLKLPTLLKDDVSVWWIRARKDLTGTSRTVVKWVTELY